MFVYVARFQLAYVSSGFVAIFLSFDHLLPFLSCLSRQKILMLQHTSLLSFFVVALSQHICLAFFLSYCRDKVLRWHDISLLSPLDNYRDRGFDVATDFSCLTLS